MLRLALPLLLLFSTSAPAQELVQFQNGQVADADDINSNFQLLKSSIDNAGFVYVDAEGTVLGYVSPISDVLVSHMIEGSTKLYSGVLSTPNNICYGPTTYYTGSNCTGTAYLGVSREWSMGGGSDGFLVVPSEKVLDATLETFYDLKVNSNCTVTCTLARRTLDTNTHNIWKASSTDIPNDLNPVLPIEIHKR